MRRTPARAEVLVFLSEAGNHSYRGKMTLIEAIGTLGDFEGEDTIYAERPWTPGSTAIIARERQTGRVPPEAAQLGLDYFLEISIAREVIEDWVSTLRDSQTLQQKCDRIIRYAMDDA